MCYELELVDDIDLQFLIKGHSKHANDTGFGLIATHFKNVSFFESYLDVC